MLLEKMSDFAEPSARMDDDELGSSITQYKQFVETCASVEKVLVEAMTACGYQSKGNSAVSATEDGPVKEACRGLGYCCGSATVWTKGYQKGVCQVGTSKPQKKKTKGPNAMSLISFGGVSKQIPEICATKKERGLSVKGCSLMASQEPADNDVMEEG